MLQIASFHEGIHCLLGQKSTAHKKKCRKLKNNDLFCALKLSDVAFILLIDNCWHFDFMRSSNPMLSSIEQLKKTLDLVSRNQTSPAAQTN